LQLALYQRFYCRVARGSVWAVTVTDTERQAALMALVVRPFRRPLTVNMAKQRHMAVDTDMTPDVPAALMVSVKAMVLVTAQAASVKLALDMAQVASVKLALDMVQAALAPAQDLANKLDTAGRASVKPDMAGQAQLARV
jgi:hypothetical protein